MNMPDENADFTYTEHEVTWLVDDLSRQTVTLRYQDLQAIVKDAVWGLTPESMQIPERNADIVIILKSVHAQYLALENEERLPGKSGRNKTKLQILKRFLELFHQKFKSSWEKLMVSKDWFNQILNKWLQEKKCYFTS